MADRPLACVSLSWGERVRYIQTQAQANENISILALAFCVCRCTRYFSSHTCCIARREPAVTAPCSKQITKLPWAFSRVRWQQRKAEKEVFLIFEAWFFRNWTIRDNFVSLKRSAVIQSYLLFYYTQHWPLLLAFATIRFLLLKLVGQTWGIFVPNGFPSLNLSESWST